MSANYCWLLPDGKRLDIPTGSQHEEVALQWLEKNPKENEKRQTNSSFIILYCVNQLNWIRLHHNAIQMRDLDSSNLSRITKYIQNHLGDFNIYGRQFVIESSYVYYEFSRQDMEEVDFNFERAINLEKRRKRMYQAKLTNILKLSKQTTNTIKRIFYNSSTRN